MTTEFVPRLFSSNGNEVLERWGDIGVNRGSDFASGTIVKSFPFNILPGECCRFARDVEHCSSSNQRGSACLMLGVILLNVRGVSGGFPIS